FPRKPPPFCRHRRRIPGPARAFSSGRCSSTAASRAIQIGPIFMQLIAAVLGHEKPPVRVKVEALAVAQAGRKTLLGRKPLVRLVSVVAPNSGSRLELDAGIMPRRERHTVLYLAGVGRRSKIDKKVTRGID